MGSGWELHDENTDVTKLRARRTYVVVLLDERGVQMLPPSGTVTIGRSRDSQIFILHASVSREHAVLDVDSLTLTDLGSRNGTFVGGERITPHTPVSIGRGEPIVIGDVTMFVHSDEGSSPSLGTPLNELPLEPRLVDETARAARHGTQFVHARVHVTPAQADAARELLLDSLRTSDVMGEDGPGAFQLLLPAITGDRARSVVQRLVASLERQGIKARAGVACYPHNGVTAAQLSAYARELVSTDAKDPRSSMDEVMQMTANVANSELTVLVTGETGVGKELIAEMIHRISPRAQGPFLRINCAAIAEQLLESELFGHARGAFTGAEQARAGLFEAGAGGTVLLDEIGEMSFRIQASLLRVLEERVVRRVGETVARPVDVRIVCATNRDLAQEVELGRFRRDLYYRISGITISIPPLRERQTAIEAIARAFAALASVRTRRGPAAFTDEAIEALRTSPWPGNIRELRNAIERAVLLAGAGPIRPAELGLGTERSFERVTERISERSAPIPFADTAATTEPLSMPAEPVDSRGLSSEVAELERARIVEALERFGGNQTRAARALGLSRTTLAARMEAYALRRPRK